MKNNAFSIFQDKFNKGKKDKTVVRNLYLVMEKVGGYEQLLNLSLPSLNEIFECMEEEANEQNKAMKKGGRRR